MPYHKAQGFDIDFLHTYIKNEEQNKDELSAYVERGDLKSQERFSNAINHMETEKIIQVLKTLNEQQKKKRGISNQQVCCLSCVDTNQNHFLQTVCVGRIQPAHIEKSLVPHFSDDTVLVTDSHRAYRTVASRHKIPLKQIPSGKHTSGGYHLGHINGYHHNISDFMYMYHGVKPATVNIKLTALDRFLVCNGWQDCRVKHLKLQRRLFRESSRELTRAEYERLVEKADVLGKKRLVLLMETICATGIRVSELQYITREAVQRGKAEITLKGKIRTILIPGKLCRKLEKYAREQKIASGEIFLTRSGRSLCRKQIWAEMKAICRAAGVEESKVFPHNLRHLFARAFYKACRDVARLADVLGHSSIETTRIYLISTGVEHAKTLDMLRLVS